MKRNSFLLFVAILFTSVSVSFCSKETLHPWRLLFYILRLCHSRHQPLLVWRTGRKRENDVKRVEDTWWYLLINEHGYQMERNNSYSGSTVCHTGYEKADYSDRSFVTRMDNLGNPDVLLVFGGTNDSWAKAPIGSYQYADWTKADLYSFRPAFCRLMDYLTKRYPDTRIYNITNTELSEDVINSMDEICRHYGVTNIRLRDIDKQWGHPSIKGMKSICEQVCKVVEE